MTIIPQVLDTTANVPVWAQPVAGLLRPQSACSISAFLDHSAPHIISSICMCFYALLFA
jgi:hypothetical protein